jgi:acyl-CoA thioesterase YciA
MRKGIKKPSESAERAPERGTTTGDGAAVFPRNQIPSIRRVMMPRDTNAFGTIFGGVILSEIDLAAAVEAHRHHAGRLVTVAMDGVVFRAPVHVGDCVSFFTETLRIGETSIRVQVRVWAEARFSTGREVFVTEAEVTMVAVDDGGRKVPILARTPEGRQMAAKRNSTA